MKEVRHCPHCEAKTTMIKVEYWFGEGEPERRYRCMNCLWLFTKDMKEVRYWKNPSPEK